MTGAALGRRTLAGLFMRNVAVLVVGSVAFILIGLELTADWVDYEGQFEAATEIEEQLEALVVENDETRGLYERYLEALEAAEATEAVRGDIALYSLCGAALLLGLIAAYVNARRLAAPISSVARAARQLSQGTLDLRVSVDDRAPLEIQDLARSTNELALILSRTERQLRFTAAAAAHEIRTPLAVLRGRLHAHQDGLIDLGSHEVDSLLRRLDGLELLISDVEQLSMLQEGGFQIERKRTDLSAVVLDAVAAAQHADPELQVTCRGTGAAVWVDIDATRLRQVCTNILTNAVIYAGASVHVEITLTPMDKQVSIVFVDDGPGFSPEALKHATDPYWRDEASRSRDTGGSGLGLGIAQAIVARHDGRLALSNSPGGGAVIRVTLPR
ncbi:MAG: ATP-binding protein [Pseudomonadota bacterium]